MYKGKTPAEIQHDILGTYFEYLTSTGYLNDTRTSQLLTAVLLLDTISFFADYIDSAYIEKVEKYLRKSKCCNCAIVWDSIAIIPCKECTDSEQTPTDE